MLSAKQLGLGWGLALLLVGAGASAQVEPEEAELEESSAEGTEEAGSDEELLGDDSSEEVSDEALDETMTSDELTPPTDTSPDTSPREEPGQVYHFVGLRYRGIFVPKFLINLFADGGTTVYVDNIGPEYAYRKDDFEFNLAATYADYGLDATPFKAKNDPPTGWEVVESNMKMLLLTSDFMWTTPITPEFGINYGAGVGLGIVFGDLIRSEGFHPGGVDAINSNGDGVINCQQPGGPNMTDFVQCPPRNDDDVMYNEDQNPWPVFPWFAVQTGLRYKPHRNFVARLDLGLGTSGFFFGLGADYGL